MALKSIILLTPFFLNDINSIGPYYVQIFAPAINRHIYCVLFNGKEFLRIIAGDLRRFLIG